MANTRAIVKRRKTIVNIEKITRTMQLIATAKYQKALHRASAAKPYTERITELVQQLSVQLEDIQHPLLRPHAPSGKVAILTLTSNRGLCGGFNAQILRTTLEHIQTLRRDNVEVFLDVVGKKGVSYFRFLRQPTDHQYTHFEDRVPFESVKPLADEYMNRYIAGELDAVYVVHMHYVSVGRQKPRIVRLLPLSSEAQQEDTPRKTPVIQYDFSPGPEELLAKLLPETVRVRLYQCFTDNIVSEQIARMVAMKSATDAAKEMKKSLTRRYNRARQTQITMELLDIIGGVEALS